MLRLKKILTTTTMLGVASLFALPNAKAVEHLSAYQSGVSTGSPTGALPPPGWYFSNDTYFVSGQIVNNEGNKIGVKELEAADSVGILWVAPTKIWGASYAAAARQSYAYRGVQTPVGTSKNSEGFFNTIITPGILSWALPDHLHNSVGLTIFLPDGRFGTTTANGKTSVNSYNYANNFWTFQPNYAISYLNNGWDVTLNTVLNFNTENKKTSYQSGDIVFFDGTVAKTFHNLTLGMIGNYTAQFSDDSLNGSAANTPHDGNRYYMALLGPMAAYQLGKVKVMLRWMEPIYSRNTLSASWVHLSMSFKF